MEAWRGEKRTFAKIATKPSGPVAPGAAYQTEDGHWHDLLATLPLDAGLIEGRPLACRWFSGTEQEVWLMLGDQPLFAEPDLLRRQEIRCCGESLYLRFGLMHEDHAGRIALAPAMYSTGLLAGVEAEQNDFMLRLREPVRRASDFRVWVWESNQITPRCLDPLELQLLNETTLLVLGESVTDPLGWLVSWEGMWRGARFHVEPGTTAWNRLAESWCHVVDDTNDWSVTAKALRAWHFPVLMQPFRERVRERTELQPLQTMDAWTSAKSILESPCGARVDGSVFDFVSPIRELLPLSLSSGNISQEFIDEHIRAVLTMDWQNLFYERAAALLRAHPVLLAKLLVTAIEREFVSREKLVRLVPVRGSFHKEPDSREMADLRKSAELVAKIVIDRLHAYAGVPLLASRPDEFSLLQEAALNDLRSWVDNSPVDSRFFDSCITEPAERLFCGEPAETKWLQVAIARSAVCCAFVATHLVYRYFYRELKNGAL